MSHAPRRCTGDAALERSYRLALALKTLCDRLARAGDLDEAERYVAWALAGELVSQLDERRTQGVGDPP
ncbi:MAG TPA: hypothetical protein VNO84_15775 [Burkholderiaceae bacterium]|nr:hypothetical protein [Burkholderiaceae bacterium]